MLTIVLDLLFACVNNPKSSEEEEREFISLYYLSLSRASRVDCLAGFETSLYAFWLFGINPAWGEKTPREHILSQPYKAMVALKFLIF